MLENLPKTLISGFTPRKIVRFLTTQNPNTHEQSGVKPSSSYYDDLLNDAGRRRDFATVRHLLNKRASEKFFCTSKTFNFVSSDSLFALDDLLEALARLDKGFSHKSTHDSLIARLCDLDRTDEALRVVSKMLRGRWGPSACTFHPVLNALTRKKSMQEAVGVMVLMREMGIKPDLTANNSLLTAYCVAGDLTSAAGIMRKLDEEGMGANARTYDALVIGACRAGKVAGALAIRRRMEEEGISVLYSTQAHLIGALLRMGHCAQAVEFVLASGGKDKALDTESFGMLAYRLIRMKRFDEAKSVLDEMRKMGLPMGVRLTSFWKVHCGTT